MRITLHIPAPNEVYIENFIKLIFENPAGIDINCLTAGINLPIKVVISPCFSKYLSDFSVFFLFSRRNFPYFEINLFTILLPKYNAKK